MDFSSKIAINKGWSDDKKYCVADQKQKKYFLRVSDKEKLDSKKLEFDMMEKVASLGVPMCKPISIELCDDEVYSLHEWIDGKDASEIILTVSREQQYIYGVEAGSILRIIHSLPVTEVREDWEVFLIKKLMTKSPNTTNVPFNMKMVRFLLIF